MAKTSYAPPALDRRQMAAVEAGEYDFLIPTRKAIMRPDEVANAIGRSLPFVRSLIEAGRLEAHQDSAKGSRESNTITRRSVILYLAETSNYDPAFIVMRVEVVMKTLKQPALNRLIAFARKRLEQIS
ncbi:MAG: hypothetical protein LC642_00505 [Verrucomicrobiaceae bacterium]|nr:hypothetical protein [Verrucomicrobiaceae bacterium]